MKKDIEKKPSIEEVYLKEGGLVKYGREGKELEKNKKKGITLSDDKRTVSK